MAAAGTAEAGTIPGITAVGIRPGIIRGIRLGTAVVGTTRGITAAVTLGTIMDAPEEVRGFIVPAGMGYPHAATMQVPDVRLITVAHHP